MLVNASLFVYGSFVEGRVHHKKLSNFIKDERPAYAKGAAYRLPVGFPVLASAGEDWVPGQIVEFEGPDILFRLLDEFHGVNLSAKEKSLFFREPVLVKASAKEAPEMIEAYVINPAKLTSAAKRIENGDWPTDLNENPSLLFRLTDKQKDYVHKLGSSTGRDIVPIDLNLYRELMKLDLIVDKGRRLALTKLGKDLYRYLDWKWSEVLKP